MNKERDLKMAQEVKLPKFKLETDEDTCYDIYYEILTYNDEKYLYIKLVENTCDAPFYYNCSYSIDDLYKLHRAFKSFERIDFEEILPYLENIFKKNKITLEYSNKNKKNIIMNLSSSLFETPFKTHFDLYSQIITTKKDEKLLDLYNFEKKHLKILKKMKDFLNGLKPDEDIKNILELYNKYPIPGIEKTEKPIKKEENKKQTKLEEDKKQTKLEADKKQIKKEANKKPTKLEVDKKFKFKFKYSEVESFVVDINLKNTSKVDWPTNKIKLLCDKDNSDVNYSNIIYPFFDVDKGQDGEFHIIFDKKNFKPKDKKVCTLRVEVDNHQLEKPIFQIRLNINE